MVPLSHGVGRKKGVGAVDRTTLFCYLPALKPEGSNLRAIHFCTLAAFVPRFWGTVEAGG